MLDEEFVLEGHADGADAPVVLGLLVVFFVPSAWLSGTLRRRSLGSVAIWAVAGGVALPRIGVHSAHRLGRVFVLLVTLLVSAALLRLHLAIADVPFIERWRVLQPIHGLHLGSDAGALAFHALAGFSFAAVVASATVGSPFHLAWPRERRRVRADALEDEEKAALTDELAAAKTELARRRREEGPR